MLPCGRRLALRSAGARARCGAPRAAPGLCALGAGPATTDTICELADWAREAGLVRLRVQPALPIGETSGLLALGFRLGPTVTPGQGRGYARYLYPEHTQLVPLGEPEAMLRACRPKHRYNIRLAARRRVRVELTDDVEELHRQQLATPRRHRITPPSPDVYRRRLRELAWCRVYVARVGPEPVGAILVARFGARAYDLFGGTSGAYRDLMPAYGLQWQAMMDASAAGCRHYDLFGVPPTDDPNHPWHGLWRFKTGFGDRLVSSPGALDLVLHRVRAALATERSPLILSRLRPGGSRRRRP